ncbi:MAG: NADH-quinone oxidoreductase subunit J [Elusimicrobiota bacterium]
MTIEPVLALLSALALLFSVAALFQKNLYGSAVCLLGVLLQIAAVFFVQGARLLGLLQVLVYAGAVMVLLVVAVMSTPSRPAKVWGEGPPKALAWLVLAALIADFAALGRTLGADSSVPSLFPGLEKEMAATLFGPYALMLEAVGLLVLLAALAVVEEEQ